MTGEIEQDRDNVPSVLLLDAQHTKLRVDDHFVILLAVPRHARDFPGAEARFGGDPASIGFNSRRRELPG